MHKLYIKELEATMNYTVKSNGYTSVYARKQPALEDAQRRAIQTPGKSYTVYRDKKAFVTYWFDGKLQYQKEA
jgi:hypothetical protein